ncbi:hypothetical protein HETIRDRAFT_440286 [Heterobasidion irregulare TC 32-1]|uniref:Uncharacterized protein n=1 Tax=Heterobasidion irregulare (strain TC 32-1) TaxID=747525 RepID=W4K399_HETIT|nr:uncharacterized protein HETIRDRAFT_440286 [Heterobasidion irregulare TC 32-1]ETW80298.1 hypothetical protein HETIRDRAFT_440286 [Heterobasidion irregulare TC 32-1]
MRALYASTQHRREDASAHSRGPLTSLPAHASRRPPPPPVAVLEAVHRGSPVQGSPAKAVQSVPPHLCSGSGSRRASKSADGALRAGGGPA